LKVEENRQNVEVLSVRFMEVQGCGYQR